MDFFLPEVIPPQKNKYAIRLQRQGVLTLEHGRRLEAAILTRKNLCCPPVVSTQYILLFLTLLSDSDFTQQGLNSSFSSVL